MIEYLKVKNKTLAAEARIIRLEERKAKAAKRNELRQSLYEHRINRVRPEARHTQLAVGYLRGMPYRRIEQTNHKDRPGPNWSEVAKMVSRYGRLNVKPEEVKKLVERWAV